MLVTAEGSAQPVDSVITGWGTDGRKSAVYIKSNSTIRLTQAALAFFMTIS